ncbi:MAG TPA: hypothetical protein VIU14_10980 [Mesorhizobium sp.]|jgi:hypothetical protein
MMEGDGKGVGAILEPNMQGQACGNCSLRGATTGGPDPAKRFTLALLNEYDCDWSKATIASQVLAARK